MSEKTKGWQDPDNYRKMLEPYPSRDEASDAVNAFFEELRELRKKYRIADVHVIVQSSAMVDSDGSRGPDDDGKVEAKMLTSLHLGNTLEAASMTAYAFGTQKALLDDALARALKGR